MELIGRGAALDDLAERLDRHRLVTVMGAGGVGKTALAAAAAERLADRFPLGSRRVDLTRVEDPAEVASTIANQLGFPSFTALLASPTEQPALVVVDNCEHVLDAAADALDALLAACRAPVVLATSRSPLDLPQESLLLLGPLEVDDGPEGRPSPALQLFRDRARDAGVALGPEHDEAVVALCRALDGVPLALEIAAARTRVLAPHEILARLDGLEVLERPRFRGTDRHRSLRATIDWSYRQLDPPAQRSFAALAVLRNPFTAEDARAVMGGEAAEGGDGTPGATEALATLIDASLLVAEPGGDGTRYRMLATVRTFARDALVAAGRWDECWARYVGHVAAWPEALVRATGDRWDGRVVRELLDRYESTTRVLRWCLDHDDGPGQALPLLAACWGLVHQAHAEEVGALAEAALARWPDPTAPWWPDAAATAATCRYLAGRPAEALALAEAALPHAGSSPLAPATLRRAQAQARAALGDVEGASGALGEAIVAARSGLPALAWEMAAYQAELDAHRDPAGALDRVRAVRREAAEAGSSINEAWATTVEASVLLRLDPVQGAAVAADALARSRAVGYAGNERASLAVLAEAHLSTGDPAACRSALAELVEAVVARGAVSELRTATRTAAVLLAQDTDARWEDLAATAETLPVVSAFCLPGHERFPLPPGNGRPLATAEVLERLQEVLRPEPGATARPTATTAPAAPAETARRGRWVRDGDRWAVTWAGRSATLPTSKGMADLALLLARPHQDVHCLDLVGAAADAPDTGEVIDATARRRYEARVRELQAEVDEAEAHHDLARADRARAELEALVDHLAAALTPTGRARRSGSAAERARSTVTQRLRATIRKLDAHHPDLARHLAASVRTGTYCRYQPEEPVVWECG